MDAWIIAGAVLASAILLYFRRVEQESDEVKVRRMARTLVRAMEKRGEWDNTLFSEHEKRARVMLPLQEKFANIGFEWMSVIVEEAVFDMEADRGKSMDLWEAEDGTEGLFR